MQFGLIKGKAFGSCVYFCIVIPKIIFWSSAAVAGAEIPDSRGETASWRFEDEFAVGAVEFRALHLGNEGLGQGEITEPLMTLSWRNFPQNAI